jgi:tetratricopeptide (TPR) repeat protein
VIDNHRAIATLSERTGDLSSARQNYEEALRRLQGLSASDQKNASLLGDLALLRNSYASTLFRMGRSDEAASQYQAAIRAATALREKDPGNPSFRAALAAAYRGLGQTQQEGKRLQEAQSSFRSAIEIFDSLAQTAARNINTQMNLALACIDLGRVLRDLENLGPAEQQFRRAISILEKIMPGSRDHRVLSNLGIAYNRLADVYRLQGNAKLALVTYSRVEPIAELLLQKDPRNSAAYLIRAESASRMGLIHETSQDWPAALTSFQKAVAIDSEIAARDPGDLRAKSNLASSHYRVCQVRFRLLQYEAAFDSCRQAVMAWREAKSSENLEIALVRASEIRFAQAEEDGKESLRREGCSLLQEAVRMGAAVTPEIRKRLERCGVHP